MGTLSVVLAEAEPSEVVTVATTWVPVPITLAGSAATGAGCVAKAAGPAPFTVLSPRPVCGGPSRQDTKSGARTENGPDPLTQLITEPLLSCFEESNKP